MPQDIGTCRFYFQTKNRNASAVLLKSKKKMTLQSKNTLRILTLVIAIALSGFSATASPSAAVSPDDKHHRLGPISAIGQQQQCSPHIIRDRQTKQMFVSAIQQDGASLTIIVNPGTPVTNQASAAVDEDRATAKRIYLTQREHAKAKFCLDGQ